MAMFLMQPCELTKKASSRQQPETPVAASPAQQPETPVATAPGTPVIPEEPVDIAVTAPEMTGADATESEVAPAPSAEPGRAAFRIAKADDRGRLRVGGRVDPGEKVLADTPEVRCRTKAQGKYRCRARGLAPGQAGPPPHPSHPPL